MRVENKLIDVYIQEVTRRLPKKSRKDIALELRSTIEDMLPVNYKEDDVKEALNQLGNPVTLANEYKGRMEYLIGPRYYDLYMSLLKIVLPIIVVVVMIISMTQQLMNFNGNESITQVLWVMAATMVGQAFEVIVQIVFGLTVAFAILERIVARDDEGKMAVSFKSWTADDLKHVTYIAEKSEISKLNVFGCLLWTAIWLTMCLYSNQSLGIYESTEKGMHFIMPAINQDVMLSLWPILIIVALLEVGLSIYKLLVRQWTKKLAILNSIVGVILTIGFIIVLVTPNLMNEAFVKYVTDLFSISNSQWDGWFISVLIIISVVGTINNIYVGFKKSNALERY